MPRKTNNSNIADSNNLCLDNQDDNSVDNNTKTDCNNQNSKDISANKKSNKEKQFLYGKLLKINKGK